MTRQNQDCGSSIPRRFLCGVIVIVCLGVASTAVDALAVSRRTILAAGWGAATTAFCSANSCESGKRANASCIAGDTSPDCIGTYKEPIPGQRRSKSSASSTSRAYDDITIKQYILRPTREDVVVTTPDTVEDAIGILSDQRLALDEMKRLVQDGGQLQEAGIVWLAAMPKVTVAGRFVVGTAPSVTARLTEQALEWTETCGKTLDKTIDLGMRGFKGALSESSRTRGVRQSSQYSRTFFQAKAAERPREGVSRGR